jgi:hypothetical protein
MCEERTSLLAAYNDTTAVYAKSFLKLHGRIGTNVLGEYSRLADAVETARHHAERARLRLEVHMSEHGCDGNEITMHA